MMKSSSPLCVFAACLLVVFASEGAIQAQGTDSLVLTNGRTLTGKILDVSGGRVRIQSGPAQSSIPLDQVKDAVMAPPQEFQQAVDAMAGGNAAQALPILQKLVGSFMGLPTPWVRRAAAMLGDAYLATGATAKAEEAYAAFQKTYPDATELAQLGLARLAVASKDFASAEQKLEPILQKASETVYAPPSENASLGQAFFLRGQIREAGGQYPEALSDFLMAAVVFNADKAVAQQAQAKADELRKEKSVIAP